MKLNETYHFPTGHTHLPFEHTRFFDLSQRSSNGSQFSRKFNPDLAHLPFELIKDSVTKNNSI